MAIFPTEDRARMRRMKAEQAVNLAMQSRWAEAAELNEQIIEASPNKPFAVAGFGAPGQQMQIVLTLTPVEK